MRSYFFIPASKLNKLNAILALGVGDIIIDFEDSITSEQRECLIDSITDINDFWNYWYRVPLRDSFSEAINLKYVRCLVKQGVKKIVIPKVRNRQELYYLLNDEAFYDLKVIILVEHPKLLLELEDVFYNDKLASMIYGIALGSHDLINELNATYSLSALDYPRQKLKYIASAYNKVAIDIASMNVGDKAEFVKELFTGINFGFEAKFIIHPIQYKWLLGSIEKLPDYIWAKKIIDRLPEGRLDSNHEPFKIDGKIVEKPHIGRALKIIKKYDNNG